MRKIKAAYTEAFAAGARGESRPETTPKALGWLAAAGYRRGRTEHQRASLASVAIANIERQKAVDFEAILEQAKGSNKKALEIIKASAEVPGGAEGHSPLQPAILPSEKAGEPDNYTWVMSLRAVGGVEPTPELSAEVADVWKSLLGDDLGVLYVQNPNGQPTLLEIPASRMTLVCMAPVLPGGAFGAVQTHIRVNEPLYSRDQLFRSASSEQGARIDLDANGAMIGLGLIGPGEVGYTEVDNLSGVAVGVDTLLGGAQNAISQTLGEYDQIRQQLGAE